MIYFVNPETDKSLEISEDSFAILVEFFENYDFELTEGLFDSEEVGIILKLLKYVEIEEIEELEFFIQNLLILEIKYEL